MLTGAILQIPPGCGTADRQRLRHRLSRMARRWVAKQLQHGIQRQSINPGRQITFWLPSRIGIKHLVNLPLAGAIVTRQHTPALLIPRKRLPQTLIGNRLHQIIKRPPAHRFGDGFHITGGRGKHDSAGIARLHQFMQQRDALPIRQIVIQQNKPGFKTFDHHTGLRQIARQPYLAETGNMADIFRMHFRQQRFILNDQ